MIDEKQIQDWLADEGMFRQKIQDDNSNFHFMINFPDNNNAMDIIQPKGKEDLLIIGCATQVSNEEQNLISSTNKTKNQQFIWDVRFTLNNMLLDFQLNHPNDQLQGFFITDQIFEDGLTKDMLIKTIKRIFKGKLSVMWLIAKTYGLQAPNPEASKDNMFI